MKKNVYLRQNLLDYSEMPVPKNNEMDVLAPIACYDYSMAGNNAAERYNIESETEIEDGVRLVEFHCGCDDDSGVESFSFCSAAIVYDDGEVFVLYDWHGDYPHDADDIAYFEWVHAQTGHSAIMMNGLPRILA